MSNAIQIKQSYRVAGILMLGIVLVGFAGFRDSVWTYAFYKHAWPVFTDVMARSVYEGDWPGISDIGVTLPILVFFYWIYLRKRKAGPAAPEVMRKLKFVYLSGLFAPLVTIHSFKWIISRARPKVFLTEVLPALDVDPANIWLPGFMHWSGPRGYSWNSFPSGHTSTCAVLLVFVYLANSHRERWFNFVAVLALTCAMGISRSMAGMHWISDSVASFFLVWAVIDTVWYKVCRGHS